MRFAFFPFHLSKVPRLQRKSEARSYEVLHLSRKIIFANLKISCSKMQHFSGNQRPHLLTALLRLPREMHLSRSSLNVPCLPSLLEMLQNLHVFLSFGKVQNPLRLLRKTTSEPSKAVRACGVFYTDLELCFAPQRRAFFRHLNFQKRSEPGVFCTFWLRNVLRAATACHLPRRLRTHRFAYFSTLRSHQSLEKHSASRISYFSARLTFFLLTLSLLWFSFFSSFLWLFPPLLFHLSILSEVWLLNFLRLFINHMID